jgi:hypothetical protein
VSITGHQPPEPRTLEDARQVTVILPDGRRVPCTKRVAALIVWLVARADQLNAIEFATVTFDLAGDIKTSFEERGRLKPEG